MAKYKVDRTLYMYKVVMLSFNNFMFENCSMGKK